MIKFSITLQSDTTLEDEQQLREKLLAAINHTLFNNNQINAIVGSSLVAEASPTYPQMIEQLE